MEKIGRNDPCPCGSGKKYKKCCLGSETTSRPAGEEVRTFGDDIREMLERRSFGSLKEANAYLSWQMGMKNRSAISDFEGLSPEQMGRFLYNPFESPQLVSFPQVLAAEPSAPIITLFKLLAEAIGEEGLKATATGNLPRQFCRDAALAFYGEEEYKEVTRFSGINAEPDFGDLNKMRVVAELAGLVRKYKGKFILSSKCRDIMAKNGMAGIYPKLFEAFASRYEWGYQDRYLEFPLIQQSFAFTLYLLSKWGGELRPASFYEDKFLKAFPAILREAPDTTYMSGEEMVRGCYTLRALERFTEFMGLTEIEREGKRYLPTSLRIRALPLLDEVVTFLV
jgi:hypothetical protein